MSRLQIYLVMRKGHLLILIDKFPNTADGIYKRRWANEKDDQGY